MLMVRLNMLFRHALPIVASLSILGLYHWGSGATTLRGAPTPDAPSAASVTLDQLCSGRAQILDLTYALNDQNAYWPAPNYEPFRLKTIATLEQNGVLSKALSCPEHLGTHLDAPNHFEQHQPSWIRSSQRTSSPRV
jgi:hypothetical protein